MRKLLAIAFLLLFTSASSARLVANLKNQTLCFPDYAFTVREVAHIPKTVKDDLYQLVLTKLKAYRIPFNTTCEFGKDIDIWLTIDSTDFKSGFSVYTYSLGLYDLTGKFYPTDLEIYSVGGFGSTSKQGVDIVTMFKQNFSDMMDQFAADYATANP